MRQQGFPYYEFENYHLDLDRFAAIKAKVAHLAKAPRDEETFFKILVNAYLMGVKDAVEMIGEEYELVRK